jgi:triacylglycerol esterase/lipase EstA (alpha/beta hydrolase family)
MNTALSLLAVHGLGLAAYVAWATSRFNGGLPAWCYVVLVPLGYALLVLLITLADFTLAWFWRSPRPQAVRIGPADTLRMVGREFRALLPSALRMIGYGLTARQPTPARASLPVVLVHGVLCNGGVWSSLAAACTARGIAPLYRLSYGPPLASIDVFAAQLAVLVDAALADTGAARVAVVAHSMGGLVVRAYIATHGGSKLARVITLGTPNQGSNFARLMVGTALAQMRPGNAWLAALPQRVDSPPFMTLWSWHDSMVAPQLSGPLPGAQNIALTGIGHNSLLHHPAVITRVTDELLRMRAAGTAR